jgi:hypothetical protein
MWFERRRERERRDAEAEARSAWLDAAALLEARSRADFKQVHDANLALVDTLTELRADFARRDAHLSATLAQLGSVCVTLTERIEADREERRELVQTITALASALAEHVNAPAGQLIGGSVYGTRPDDDTVHDIVHDDVPATIDLVALEGDAAASAPVPGDVVRCRFGDRWVDGFEILEVHSRGGRARCRVRRRSDGSIVRKLFETTDLQVIVRRPQVEPLF